MHVCRKEERQSAKWRIPVGTADTTRRRGWLTTIMATTQKKEKERRRDGRGGTRVGATRSQKLGGEGAPIDVGTGGVRGSDERSDRRAEERQKRVQT